MAKKATTGAAATKTTGAKAKKKANKTGKNPGK